MVGTDAGWPADVEFVEYVRARQHTLLRAAYLVCGDVGLAEDLVRRALTRLARHWERVREEAPDVYVRGILYRDAVASWGGRRPEAVAPVPDELLDRWDADEVERRREVLAALDTLTPRQRATIVLRWFDERSERDTAEILGCSPATVRSEAHDGLAALRTALPRVEIGTEGSW